MRLIPVIDLLDGQAVLAIKGERAHYKPVKSVLCDASDPVSLARAFRARLGLCEIYVADLNAIQNSGNADHREVINALTREERLNIILDAGIADVAAAKAWLGIGVRKVVIGSETLSKWNALHEIAVEIEQDRRLFSLDLRAGKILSRHAAMAAMSPIEALQHLQSSGWREIIMLDLKRVGSGEGADRAMIRKVREACPDLRLLVGGGINNPGELSELESLGIAGALVATAFHRGTITAQHISAMKTAG
jgi:phosphoribosylformimino-5-aminoimidazole carboxamide ribotide isomerase